MASATIFPSTKLTSARKIKILSDIGILNHFTQKWWSNMAFSAKTKNLMFIAQTATCSRLNKRPSLRPRLRPQVVTRSRAHRAVQVLRNFDREMESVIFTKAKQLIDMMVDEDLKSVKVMTVESPKESPKSPHIAWSTNFTYSDNVTVEDSGSPHITLSAKFTYSDTDFQVIYHESYSETPIPEAYCFLYDKMDKIMSKYHDFSTNKNIQKLELIEGLDDIEGGYDVRSGYVTQISFIYKDEQFELIMDAPLDSEIPFEALKMCVKGMC